MRHREDKDDIVGYHFDMEEMVVLKTALDNSIVRAYIQTLRTNYITEHVLTPLLDYQQRGPNVRLNIALNEAYLKGAVDFATDLLSSVQIPGEE